MCPFVPGANERLYWSPPDPSAVGGTEERLEIFRAVRRRLTDLIKADLTKDLLNGKGG